MKKPVMPSRRSGTELPFAEQGDFSKFSLMVLKAAINVTMDLLKLTALSLVVFYILHRMGVIWFMAVSCRQ